MRRALAAVAFGALAITSAAPAAEGDRVRYLGETEDGRKVKLLAEEDGTVVRGAITAVTDCSGSYDDFRARADFGPPLDRSTPRGFRDQGTFIEDDDTYSARYKYRVRAERESDRVLTGELDLTVVFREDGEKYVECIVEDLVFSAEREKTG